MLTNCHSFYINQSSIFPVPQTHPSPCLGPFHFYLLCLITGSRYGFSCRSCKNVSLERPPLTSHYSVSFLTLITVLFVCLLFVSTRQKESIWRQRQAQPCSWKYAQHLEHRCSINVCFTLNELFTQHTCNVLAEKNYLTWFWIRH